MVPTGPRSGRDVHRVPRRRQTSHLPRGNPNGGPRGVRGVLHVFGCVQIATLRPTRACVPSGRSAD
ncbi:hypothetical protein BN2537_12141 [Streptomyces venezuelae]|nr:hypothetical protein BN2537_12141 [Streptomyces venezuelae]